MIETKKKYTIEDLKTNKIAVHLPTRDKWGDFCNKTGIACLVCYPFMSKEECKNTCVSYDEELECFLPIVIKVCKQLGYTIITLDQLQMEEEYETEEQIQNGFTPIAEEEVVETNCGDVNIINNSYNDDSKTCTVDLYGFKQVIIKYQGKKKVITRDDFDNEEK